MGLEMPLKPLTQAVWGQKNDQSLAELFNSEIQQWCEA